MSKFTFEETPLDASWDSFVEDSPQGTIFSTSAYLKASGVKPGAFYVKKGNDIRGAVVLNETNHRIAKLDDLVIYNGVLHKKDLTTKPVRARNERHEITKFIIDELLLRYDHLEFSLSESFEDLRPFLWLNYHSNNPLDKFELDLRYSSYLNITSLKDSLDGSEESLLFKNLDSLRQRNLREAKKVGAQVKIQDCPKLLLQNYVKLMESQNELVEIAKIERMRSIIETLVHKNKAFIACSISPSGANLYQCVFCFDSKRAYYLFGAGDLDASERYKGTLAFWGSFEFLAKKYGIKEVDLEGVNSPQRGFYKLSFGGNLKPYFEVIKRSS